MTEREPPLFLPVRFRKAFTLIELLVVIAIIGVLVALLLPAVQQAREAARRAQCRNQLKQLGLALHNYVDAYSILPPGGTRPLAESIINGANNSWGTCWTTRLLPYIDQANLYNQYNFDIEPRSGTNAAIIIKSIPTLLCPSDSPAAPWVNPSNWAPFAKGNYAANFGMGNPWSMSDFNLARRGPFRAQLYYGARLKEISDGLSNTVFLSELIAAKDAGDVRGSWAFPPGVFFCGMSYYPDDVTSAASLELVPNGNALDNSKMDRPSYCSADNNDRDLRCLAHRPNQASQTARSKHTGGVHICLGDGSVRFISDFINVKTWQALLGQDDGIVVGNY